MQQGICLSCCHDLLLRCFLHTHPNTTELRFEPEGQGARVVTSNSTCRKLSLAHGQAACQRLLALPGSLPEAASSYSGCRLLSRGNPGAQGAHPLRRGRSGPRLELQARNPSSNTCLSLGVSSQLCGKGTSGTLASTGNVSRKSQCLTLQSARPKRCRLLSTVALRLCRGALAQIRPKTRGHLQLRP